ncbi:hypothetical protein RFI_11951 [Reticulomyxa filosa]|uniref:Kelch motif family protein n=1 Tax=Reticulomyxa filosa TaxID=46433 RepID=X6NFT6_RETFI|nr:hypothetical protein RFI_11951 [Reticulomyxa filosa]|eukprot:ETO25185.1 hypothetical protein RFI_11951 [Reticulomyxa filosa]
MADDHSPFEQLHQLPNQYYQAQCVLLQDELLILGGRYNNNCYTYSISQSRYKFICSYPDQMSLWGHAVVKLKDKKKGAKLLSFGGMNKHTLILDYESVWNTKSKKNHSWATAPQKIGDPTDDLRNVRALIGGTNDQFLFYIYAPKHIVALDSKSLKMVASDILPFDGKISGGNCFVKAKQNKMLLFGNTNHGLAITYNEQTKTFQYQKLALCFDLWHVWDYAYVYVGNFVILFGGYDYVDGLSLNKVHIYNIKQNRWKQSSHKLSMAMKFSFAIFREHDVCIYIMGGVVDGYQESRQLLKLPLRKILERVL